MDTVLGQPTTQYIRDSIKKQKFSFNLSTNNMCYNTVYHGLKQTILEYMTDNITKSAKFRMCFAMDLSVPGKDETYNNFTSKMDKF